ncbi:histidine phosphatase family (branch protein 1) (macronuclear) [Tetrahymena thermophila SB210]|uniref:Histidine phosphatase family (Branch protein 1) n=1 Tax=Tetrahymena thermophila (strain SB210) TaxID=312017 RepID=I7MKY7_TETTS|nr:histidine phosphatase family (branch protein 1) [Tetrahymena thermophila SB210]EAS00629.1 histidine phosphatase family (branch protein 1) [Tetrahymena thermophila SB210]|eukprot:XP_001020874.1 histidine phosphatase family (branch protein 1) [Tetrahymena thermophila SB210]
MEKLTNEENQLIKDFHLHLEANLYDDPSKSNVIVIRHAFTQQNKDQHIYEIKRGGIFKQDPEWRQLMLDEVYFDTPLHNVGIHQCLANQEKVNEIDFEVVLVSPLQRTLQTCLYLFQNHPNRQKIHFLIYPLVSEGVCATSCLAYETNTSLRERMTKLAQSYNINLDFSLLDQKQVDFMWQLEQIQDEKIQGKYKDCLQKIKDEKEYRQFIIQEMTDSFPHFFENWELMFKRAQVANKEISQFIQKYPNIVNNTKKLGIVTHSHFITCMTAKGFNHDGIADGIVLKNCQIAPVFIE